MLNVNTGVTYNLNDGLIDFGLRGGDRVAVHTGGVFNMTGGTVQGGGFNAASTGSQLNLLGGISTNFRRGFEIWNASAVITVGGNFSIASVDLGENLNSDSYISNSGSNNASGKLIFSLDWTGYFTDASDSGVWTAADWTNALIDDEVYVDTTKITAGNFGDFFQVNGSGQLSMIPEPSVALLGALGMLGLLRRRC